MKCDFLLKSRKTENELQNTIKIKATIINIDNANAITNVKLEKQEDV